MLSDQEMRALADKATEGPWATATPEPPTYAAHSQNECRCNDSEDYEYRFHRHDRDGGHWHQQIDSHHVYADNVESAYARWCAITDQSSQSEARINFQKWLRERDCRIQAEAERVLTKENNQRLAEVWEEGYEYGCLDRAYTPEMPPNNPYREEQ